MLRRRREGVTYRLRPGTLRLLSVGVGAALAVVTGATIEAAPVSSPSQGNSLFVPAPAQSAILPCGSPIDCIKAAAPDSVWDVLEGAAALFLTTTPTTAQLKKMAAALAVILRGASMLPVLATGCLASIACAAVIGLVGTIIVIDVLRHYNGGEKADNHQYLSIVPNEGITVGGYKGVGPAPVHESPGSMTMMDGCRQVGACSGTALWPQPATYQDGHLLNVRWVLKYPASQIDYSGATPVTSEHPNYVQPTDFGASPYWMLAAAGVSDTGGVPSAGTGVTPSTRYYCSIRPAFVCDATNVAFPIPYYADYNCSTGRYLEQDPTTTCSDSGVGGTARGHRVNSFLARQMWRQYGPPPPYCYTIFSQACDPAENSDANKMLGQVIMSTNDTSTQAGTNCPLSYGCKYLWSRIATPFEMEEYTHPVRAASTAPPDPINGTATLNLPPKAGFGGSAEYDAVMDAVGRTDNDTATWIAAQLPNSPYADPTGTPTDFNMPDCHGESISVCENNVREAYVANGTSSPSFILETYPVGDPDVCGACVLTSDPAAGSVVTAPAPSTVTLTINPASDQLPFALPELDQANETYTEYVTRLRAMGYLGTITRVNLSLEASDPMLGPLAPAVVHIPAVGLQTPVDVIMSAFPATAPLVGIHTPVEIEVNAPNAPVVGGGGVVDPDACCPLNALNFDALTALSCSDKFPCGLFTYAAAVVGEFNVSPDAPRFEFENLAGTTTDYEVDLEVADPYVSVIRSLLTFCMWIGAVWVIAARMLRIDAAGDPGGAVDEAV